MHDANEREDRKFLQPFSRSLKDSLRDGKVPVPISIAYDPELPTRNWVEGVENDQWRLYNFLGYMIVIQGVALFNFAVFLACDMRYAKTVPWWHDLHMVFPLMVEAVCLGFAGVIVGVTGLVVDLVFGN